MKISIEKMSAVAIILLILAVPLLQTSRASTVNSATRDKMTAFLSDVIGLDLTKYNITNENYGFNYPPYYDSNVKEEHLTLDLVSDEGIISVMCMFLNGFNGGIFVYAPTNGSMIFKHQPSTNALDESKNILQRYQTFAQNYDIDTSHVTQALTLLSNATRAASSSANLHTFNNIAGFVPSVTTAGNIKQETTQTGVKWIYTDKGVDMPNKCIAIDFGANELHFADTWNLYTIGCFSVISEDEAKGIGWEAAKNFNLTLIGENDTLFSVQPELSNMADVALRMIPGQIYNRDHEDHFVNPSNATRDPLALYPLWQMVFYFNENIGGTVGIQVGVWGDTKEIAYINEYGYLGGSGATPTVPTEASTPTEPSAIPSATSAKPENSNPPLNMYLIAGATAIAMAVAVAAVALKKRSK